MMRPLGLAAAVALLLAGCETDRPIVTAIARDNTIASACDRFRKIGPSEIELKNREHAIEWSLCWIERNSGYVNLPPPQQWVELSREHIAALSQHASAGGSPATALYSCRASAVYFEKGFDLGKFENQTILVHELVHHAQCVHRHVASTPDRACTNEMEAYGLQARYIRHIGERVRDAAAKAEVMVVADAVEKTGHQVCERLRSRRR